MVICGEKLQVCEGPVNKSPRFAEAVPAEPVNKIRGKNAARAAPMSAFAALRVCSAAKMSGLRCKTSDGTSAGTRFNKCCCPKGFPVGKSFGKGAPTRSE